MNSRERVRTTLDHREPDRIPFDLGGTPMSGIHKIAYRNLRRYLGLPEVEIRITDTGPGIDDAVAEKFFQAFQGSTRPGGTGLGMTIAAELMRAHGGTISIESTSPSGTVMLLTLPKCSTATEALPVL